MSAKQDNPLIQENSLLGEVLRNGLEGQKAILDEQLKKGIPLVMQDQHGRLFQKNPDGSIEYTQENWGNRK